jgi:YbbR domain-containing protein
VFGTEVQFVLSGLVWNVTVELRVPVVLTVTRQLTQGVFADKFELETAVKSPVKVRVKAQSVCWA